MKNIATFMLVSALMLGFFTSCDSGVQHRTFRGIYADDPAGMEGLYNPERGFRLEVALDVTEKNYVWAPEEYPDITSYLEEQSELYASDSVSLVQTYFYLTGAVGKELTGEDFRTMGIFFDKLRSLGKKAVLRFAYETQFLGRAATGPSTPRLPYPFRLTSSSIRSTFMSISLRPIFLIFRPKAMLSRTFRWGNSAYFWNTVFTRRL